MPDEDKIAEQDNRRRTNPRLREMVAELLGGVNLFNHAAIGYVDASGLAHVMILGGDDVSNPGTRRATVYFY